MFGTIRKHQSWLWFLIIAVMIIGMITWTSQIGKSGNGRSATGNFGSIDGKTITADEFMSARNEAVLMYRLQTDQWPDTPEGRANFDSDRETYQRLLFIRKLDEYNIHPDADSVAQLAALILRRFGNNGQPVPLEVFADQVLRPHGITTEDFQKFLDHYLGIQQLAAVVGAGGKLVTPQEIQSLYVQNYQEIAVDAVFFTASNYLAKVPEPTPEELGQFYTNQEAAYREPDRMQVRYVFFNATNYLAQSEKQIGTTNLNEEAREALTRLGTNGLRYGKTPEEAQARIRNILVRDVAISNAWANAVTLENQITNKAENLEALARHDGLEMKVTKPFEKEYGPSELELPSSYPVSELFNLTPDDPLVPAPVRGLDGVYIIAFDKLIPSRIPPLDEIRSRVISDYKLSQATRLAQISGHVFAQTATNEIAHGKSFADISTQSRVTPLKIPPFSLSSERLPEVEDLADVPTFKQVAANTRVGGVSAFIPTRDGGFVVHVSERLPIDAAKMKEQLPEFSNAVRQRRQGEEFEFWFQRQWADAVPYMTQLQSSRRQGPS